MKLSLSNSIDKILYKNYSQNYRGKWINQQLQLEILTNNSDKSNRQKKEIYFLQIKKKVSSNKLQRDYIFTSSKI